MTFLDRFNYARRHDGDRESGKGGASSAGAVPAAGASAPGAEGSSAEGAGTRTGEYVGWRAWNLVGDRLYSCSYNVEWEGPVANADVIPTRANSNGIYAVTSLEAAPYTDVWGEVALSGIVVVGESGYRAQTAVIRSLYVGREMRPVTPDGVHPAGTFEFWPSDALVRALEARYHVEVHVEPESRLAQYNRLQTGDFAQAYNPYYSAIAALQHAMGNIAQSSASTQVYPGSIFPSNWRSP